MSHESNRPRFNDKIIDKVVESAIEHALIGPVLLAFGVFSGWVFTSADSSVTAKVLFGCALMVLLLAWALSLIAAFCSDRVRLYWLSLATFARRGMSYRHIHVLREYLAAIRRISNKVEHRGDATVLAFDDAVWWLECYIDMIYSLYLLKNGHGSFRGGIRDKVLSAACAKVFKCWAQIDSFIPGEPDVALEQISREEKCGESLRREAAQYLKHVRIMRESLRK